MPWWLRRGAGGGTKSLGLVTRRSIPNRFDSHVQGGEVDIKKRRICSIILIQFVHILGEE